MRACYQCDRHALAVIILITKVFCCFTLLNPPHTVVSKHSTDVKRKCSEFLAKYQQSRPSIHPQQFYEGFQQHLYN